MTPIRSVDLVIPVLDEEENLAEVLRAREEWGLPFPVAHLTGEAKADLLERALSEVKESYVGQDMESHWYVFRDRLLQPLIDNQQPVPLKQICKMYGIDDEATASHMLETVKRRFQSVLKKQVRQTVLTGEVVEEELKEILKFFEKKSEI